MLSPTVYGTCFLHVHTLTDWVGEVLITADENVCILRIAVDT